MLNFYKHKKMCIIKKIINLVIQLLISFFKD